MGERGSRVGFVLKPYKLSRIEHGRKGEDFQRHAAPEGNLFRLVDHAHPTAADLTENPEVADNSSPILRGGGRRDVRRRIAAGNRTPLAQVRQELQRRQHFAQPLGMFRALRSDRLLVEDLSLLDPLRHALEKIGE